MKLNKQHRIKVLRAGVKVNWTGQTTGSRPGTSHSSYVYVWSWTPHGMVNTCWKPPEHLAEPRGGRLGLNLCARTLQELRATGLGKAASMLPGHPSSQGSGYLWIWLKGRNKYPCGQWFELSLCGNQIDRAWQRKDFNKQDLGSGFRETPEKINTFFFLERTHSFHQKHFPSVTKGKMFKNTASKFESKNWPSHGKVSVLYLWNYRFLSWDELRYWPSKVK